MNQQQYQQEINEKLIEKGYLRFDYPHNSKSYSIMWQKNFEEGYIAVRFWDHQALDKYAKNRYDIEIYKDKGEYATKLNVYAFSPSSLFEVLEIYERETIPTT